MIHCIVFIIDCRLIECENDDDDDDDDDETALSG